MKTVWKYKVELVDVQNIEMKQGAEILVLQKQGNRHEDEIYIWCIVDTDAPTEVNTFHLIPTGTEILENTKYIGTLWLMNGSYVLHMFEGKKG